MQSFLKEAARQAIKKKQTVKVNYTNYKGENSTRQILPILLWFGSTQWHVNEQWLLKAKDLAKNEDRDFSLDQIHEWSPIVG